ncbi:hypothetical protein RE428_46380 [Marinobacter nanhaiticus D15-8W]|uniref:DUF7352 domain-containing protein n=1 Tax=Marinobacter nanhaiticus TaxID=1305740 RepID=UPI0009DAF611|nr:hypothetical protein [Marinobacter nanhaiticus]BES73620.1 hypothetical protein RE428_46380 [Marinobacter nanhaiticus D15-8W]
MKTVHKYRLDISGEPKALNLREGYRVVRCEYLLAEKAVYLWVEVPLNVDIPVRQRQFRVVYSGEPVPETYEHVDTALDPFGPEAYHVYALPEQTGHQRYVPVDADYIQARPSPAPRHQAA